MYSIMSVVSGKISIDDFKESTVKLDKANLDPEVFLEDNAKLIDMLDFLTSNPHRLTELQQKNFPKVAQFCRMPNGNTSIKQHNMFGVFRKNLVSFDMNSVLKGQIFNEFFKNTNGAVPLGESGESVLNIKDGKFIYNGNTVVDIDSTRGGGKKSRKYRKKRRLSRRRKNSRKH